MSANTAYALIRNYGTPQQTRYAAVHLAYGRTDAVRAILSTIRASLILAG